MKKITLFCLLLCIGASMANGQSGVTVQKCKTCGKPMKECQYKGKHPARTNTPSKQTTYLRVNGNSADFSQNCTNSNGCTFVCTVATNAQDYTLSSTQAWITFSEKTKETFKVVVEKNRLARIRDGEFTVAAGDKQVKVAVRQVGMTSPRATYLYLDGSPDNQSINCRSAEGGSYTYAVSTDTADFSIAGLPAWVTVTQKTLTSFTVRVAPNTQGSARSDFFWVKAGGKQIQVKVSQARKARSKSEAKVGFEFGAGLLVSHASVSFGGPKVGGVVNYSVNNLNNVGTEPDFSSGVGVEFHGNVDIPLTNSFSVLTGLEFALHNFSNRFQSSGWKYTTDSWSSSWGVTQDSKESYRFAMLDIPLLGRYAIPIGDHGAAISFKAGLVMGIGLSAKCKVSSHVRSEKMDASENYTGTYAESDISGSINLYTGSYSFSQKYSTGSASLYSVSDKATNPFDRFNLSLRFGTDLKVGGFLLGLSYNLGLSNIANKSYFSNVSNQVPGFYVVGEPEFAETAQPLENYKQRIGSFCISVGYSF